MTKSLRAIAAMVLLGVATIAMAFTVPELEQRADDLLGTCQAIETAAAGCPDGECTQRLAIEAALASADADLAQLHTDRATLGGGTGCQQLDATIGDIDALTTVLHAVIDGWQTDGR